MQVEAQNFKTGKYLRDKLIQPFHFIDEETKA